MSVPKLTIRGYLIGHSYLLCILAAALYTYTIQSLVHAQTQGLQERLTAEAHAKIRPHTLAVLEASPTPEFIVELKVPEALTFMNKIKNALPRQQLLDGLRQRLEAVKAPFLKRIDGLYIDFQEYSHLPYIYMRVRDHNALIRILEDHSVSAVYENAQHKPIFGESLPAIHQPEAVRHHEFRGQGTAVAILDTGVDFQHADFDSCMAVGTPSRCRVIVVQDFADNDGIPDDDPNRHGSNVAAIVAQTAPGTDIISLDVFTWVDDNSNGTIDPTDGDGIRQADEFVAFANDIINAIDWVNSNQANFNIVAMNLSLGGGDGFLSGSCPGTYTMAFQMVRAVGIIPIVAAGNDGFNNMLSNPGCNPLAVSVGAVYDGNTGLDRTYPEAGCTDAAPQTRYQVTCFSNSSTDLELFAPGVSITAGGVSQSGTSQATPHVAGAAAILHSVDPNQTANDVALSLQISNTFVTDPKTGMNPITMPVLDLPAAILDVSPHTAAILVVMEEYYAEIYEGQLLDAVGYMHDVEDLEAVRQRVITPLLIPIITGP